MRTLLIICFGALLIGFLFIIFAPSHYYPLAFETSAVRDAKNIQNAIIQYQIEHGSLPHADKIPTSRETMMPICSYEAEDRSQCFALDLLVPTYLPSVPVNASAQTSKNFSGYGIYMLKSQTSIAAFPPQTASGIDLRQLIAPKVATGSSAPTCQDIVGEWKLDENKGANVFLDSSDMNNDGVTFAYAKPVGPDLSYPKALQSPQERAWRFGGSGAVLLPNTLSLNIAGQMTFSTWIKTLWSSTDPEQRAFIFGGRKEEAPYPGFAIAMTSNGFPAYFSNTSPVSAAWMKGSHALNDGRWHHLAVTVTATGSVQFFIDGAGDHPHLGSPPSTYRGTRAIGAASNARFSFPGSLDDVRLYNRALSGNDIAALAQGKEASCLAVPQNATSTGSFVCGTCVNHQGNTGDCSCSYDPLSNSIIVNGVSKEPQQLGLTISCQNGMKISELSVTYGDNCTKKPGRCTSWNDCIGLENCPIMFSSSICRGGAFGTECPVRNGSLWFLCGN